MGASRPPAGLASLLSRVDDAFCQLAPVGAFQPFSCRFGTRTSARRLVWMEDSETRAFCPPYMVSVFDSDIELFWSLKGLLPNPNVFQIGNGFGYSTAVLATVFPRGRIHVTESALARAVNF